MLNLQSIPRHEQVCSRWCRITEELTSSYWPGFIQHPWKGDPHTDLLTAGTAARLEVSGTSRWLRPPPWHCLPQEFSRVGQIDQIDHDLDHLDPNLPFSDVV